MGGCFMPQALKHLAYLSPKDRSTQALLDGALHPCPQLVTRASLRGRSGGRGRGGSSVQFVDHRVAPGSTSGRAGAGEGLQGPSNELGLVICPSAHGGAILRTAQCCPSTHVLIRWDDSEGQFICVQTQRRKVLPIPLPIVPLWAFARDLRNWDASLMYRLKNGRVHKGPRAQGRVCRCVQRARKHLIGLTREEEPLSEAVQGEGAGGGSKLYCLRKTSDEACQRRLGWDTSGEKQQL